MKKFFTLAIAAVAALSASADVEYGILKSDEITASTEPGEPMVICQSENVTLVWPNVDDGGFSVGSLKVNSAQSGAVYGNVHLGITCITGKNNPKQDGTNIGSISMYPNSGAFYQYEVKKDGYLTIFCKPSANKSYYVFEGTGTAATPMAYIFRAENADGEIKNFELPGDDYGWLITKDQTDWYLDANQGILKAAQIYELNPESSTGGNLFGTITFQVAANFTYTVFAAGSKVGVGPFVLDTELPTVLGGYTLEEGVCTKKCELLGSFEYDSTTAPETGAINSVIADKELDVNAPIYNVMGQKVNANTKGILIQNGRKFYNK